MLVLERLGVKRGVAGMCVDGDVDVDASASTKIVKFGLRFLLLCGRTGGGKSSFRWSWSFKALGSVLV